jgi:hypothetical protein
LSYLLQVSDEFVSDGVSPSFSHYHGLIVDTTFSVEHLWQLTLIDPTSGEVNVHWAINRSVNTLFTGRKEILDDLEETVRAAVCDRPHITQCRIVISGMGGQGKSEICLQLAQRIRSL